MSKHNHESSHAAHGGHEAAEVSARAEAAQHSGTEHTSQTNHEHAVRSHEQHGEHRPSRHGHESATTAHETSRSAAELQAQIESLKKAAERQALPTESEKSHLNKKSEYEKHESPVLINQELKEIAYQRTLRRVQKDLSPPERLLSKVIHHQAVETVSEVAGKTIARPSGVLAGGFCAFLGSSLFLYVSKHYGYSYNFLLFALFFAGGFVIGIALELIRYTIRRARNS